MTLISNNRIKNSRKVIFKKDYKVGRKTYYSKGETYYIHKDLVDKLKKRGADFTAENVDYESEVAKAKKRLKEVKDKENK